MAPRREDSLRNVQPGPGFSTAYLAIRVRGVLHARTPRIRPVLDSAAAKPDIAFDMLVFPRDGRQSEPALKIQRGAARLMRAAGFAVLNEFTLSSGRRADLIGLDGRGRIHIAEIKSSRMDFLTDRKWPEYRLYCDNFYFAVTHGMDLTLLPDDAGLIIADEWGGEYLRHCGESALNPARRKAVMLEFARCAAFRLHGLADPDGGFG